MKPPQMLDVLDHHNGFTAITRRPTYVKIIVGERGEREARPDDYIDGKLARPFVRWDKVWREGDTLWRPGTLLAQSWGILVESDEHSFYQNNNNVTKAIYTVKGYPYRVAVWFDNETGERIA